MMIFAVMLSNLNMWLTITVFVVYPNLSRTCCVYRQLLKCYDDDGPSGDSDNIDHQNRNLLMARVCAITN